MGLFSKKDKTDELSKRWISEGKQFKNQLNGFLDAIYKGGDGPEEPLETREDMAEFVYHKAIELNKKGEHQKLRELFPPAFEPFQRFYDGIARSINQLIVLKNNDIIVRANGNIYSNDGNVYLLKNDAVKEQKGILAVGISSNKEYIAKVTNTEIQICKDWNETPIRTFDYPTSYGAATKNIKVANFKEEGLIILNVEVFNNGEKVLFVTSSGIFILSQKENQCLLPTQDMLPEMIENFYDDYEESETFEVTLDYMHASLSNDNSKIATGYQSSYHYIYELNEDTFEITSTIQARSEYPHAVGFHDSIDHVALASCHFQQSAVIGLDLKHLPLDINASWYGQELDPKIDAMNDNIWVYSILPYKDGYFLGANNGYIWFVNPKKPNEKSYLHVGGTIMAMDFSADKKQLVVSTFSGYIIKFDLTVSERDETLVTNLHIKETNRWVIWKDIEPLIW